jgi:hypothetical protein
MRASYILDIGLGKGRMRIFGIFGGKWGSTTLLVDED